MKTILKLVTVLSLVFTTSVIFYYFGSPIIPTLKNPESFCIQSVTKSCLLKIPLLCKNFSSPCDIPPMWFETKNKSSLKFPSDLNSNPIHNSKTPVDSIIEARGTLENNEEQTPEMPQEYKVVLLEPENVLYNPDPLQKLTEILVSPSNSAIQKKFNEFTGEKVLVKGFPKDSYAETQYLEVSAIELLE